MTAADAKWLDLRAPIDAAARQQSLHLIDHAVTAATPTTDQTEPLLIIDIGAGTGNSARWLHDRLRERMPDRVLDWVLLDADPASLDLAARVLPQARTICAQVSELPTITAGLLHTATAITDGTRPTPSTGVEVEPPRLLLTCSALLDVLTRSDLEAISDTLIDFRGIGLFVLSITGRWTLDPTHPSDAVLDEAFTAHQHRDGRLGRDAPETLARLSEDHGATIMTARSPWRLHAPRDREFLTRFLRERIDAAIDEAPHLGPTGRDWLTARLARLDTGLSVTVDHRDLLIDAGGIGRP